MAQHPFLILRHRPHHVFHLIVTLTPRGDLREGIRILRLWHGHILPVVGEIPDVPLAKELHLDVAVCGELDMLQAVDLAEEHRRMIAKRGEHPNQVGRIEANLHRPKPFPRKVQRVIGLHRLPAAEIVNADHSLSPSEGAAAAGRFPRVGFARAAAVPDGTPATSL